MVVLSAIGLNTSTYIVFKDKIGSLKQQMSSQMYTCFQDMEKWAKSMNAQKEAMKDGLKKISLPNMVGRKGEEKSSATADAGFAILEKVVSTVDFLPCVWDSQKGWMEDCSFIRDKVIT